MSENQAVAQELVGALGSPDGGYSMLALDQRESLRRMFPLLDGQEVGDDRLRRFKAAAIRILSPHASAILLDRPLAIAFDRPEGIAPGCGLILAADLLDQPPGQGVVQTFLDPEVTAAFVRHVNAVALKLLVIWRPDGRQAEREDLVRSFVALADEAGVASLVEGIAKPAEGGDWSSADERHGGILEAAKELTSHGGTIYKAEVPGYAPGDLSRVREHAQRITDQIDVPWVVLSNGTAQQDFADAVREACLGGASGFLAGRAVWADTVADAEPERALEERSVERLHALSAVVAEARAS